MTKKRVCQRYIYYLVCTYDDEEDRRVGDSIRIFFFGSALPQHIFSMGVYEE